MCFGKFISQTQASIMKNIAKLSALFFLSLSIKTAVAQKLPKTQKVSLRGSETAIGPDAPAEQFQAYNPSNRIFYTISNDDDNLYLSVGFPGNYETEKFATGGVTLIINPGKTKGGSASPSFTYPVTLYTHNGIENGIRQFKDLKDDAANNKGKLVDLPYTYNQKILKTFIQIECKGAQGVPDTISAIKNDYGIKTTAAYDKNMSMVYHLAVPLKYLQLNDSNSFTYDIRMAGLPAVEKAQFPGPIAASVDGAGIDIDGEYLRNPTHAGGEYKLAVK